jgi:branched-chain amino acid transport system permease protein
MGPLAMTPSQQIAQFLATGITEGSVYALVALGFTIIFNATGIVNFSQGEFVMVGALLGVTFVQFNLPLPAVIVLATLGATAVAVCLERLAIRPLRDAPILTMIFTTIAASLLLRGAASLAWGPNAIPMEPFSAREPFRVAGAAIVPQSVWIVGISLTAVVALQLFFRNTLTGKAMRAAASNRVAARLVGINISHMSLIAFALSGAVSGLAGVVFAPSKFASYAMGTPLAVKGFCGAILGGIGNGMGAVIGGLTLGILESLAAGLISSQYKDAITLLVMILVLFIRPTGLFGRGDAGRGL